MKAISMGYFNGKIGNAMRRVTWPGGRGSSKTIWNQRPNLPIHYITFMGLRWRLKGVYMGAPHC